ATFSGLAELAIFLMILAILAGSWKGAFKASKSSGVIFISFRSWGVSFFLASSVSAGLTSFTWSFFSGELRFLRLRTSGPIQMRVAEGGFWLILEISSARVLALLA